MTKYITINNEIYGNIGEKVPYIFFNSNTSLHVGDLVAFTYKGRVYCRPIMKYESDYGIYGFGVNGFNKFDIIKKIANYTSLTTEILKSSHEDYQDVEFEIIEAKKMTLEDIEKELGYKIELI